MSKKLIPLPPDYALWLASLKKRIAGERQRAVLAANEEQIRLYHEIGREILSRQNKEGWGAKVIHQVSTDLQIAFPEMKGFSVRNLLYMRLFAEQCPDLQFVQQSAAQLKNSTKMGQQVAGQLNLYLAAVDAQMKVKEEKSTIGILLCKTKKRLVAEYALSGIEKPIGVAEYQLVRSLPKPLDTSLPTIEELEAGLSVELGRESKL